MDGLKDSHITGIWGDKDCSLSVVKNPDVDLAGVFEVVNLFTQPESRKKGLASELMRKLCSRADTYQCVLMLQPKPFGRGRQFKGLEQFYEKFGFKRIQDEPVLMARPPQI